MKRVLFVLMFVPTVVFSAVGTITEQVNAVPSISRHKNTLTGARGTGVEMEDTINTTRGKAGITFADDTKVEINENSRLVIDDFVYDPKATTAGKLAVKVALGTVRYASGQIAKNNPQAVAVNTPAATISVRGTDFTATVDELGESTIILLPSCPQGFVDISKDCKTGVIEVANEAGTVVMTKPFEGTKVANRSTAPLKPVVLNLTSDIISNLLILSPPSEIVRAKNAAKEAAKFQAGDMLEQHFLEHEFLKNELQSPQDLFGTSPLTEPVLDQSFLVNTFERLSAQLRAQQESLLNNQLTLDPILPDFVKGVGVDAVKGATTVKLTRDTGANSESVLTSKFENSTVILIQNDNIIKNRVNNGNSTLIKINQK